MSRRSRVLMSSSLTLIVAGATAATFGTGGAHAGTPTHHPLPGRGAHAVGAAGNAAQRAAAVERVMGATRASSTARSAMGKMTGRSADATSTLPKDTQAYGVPALWNQGTTGQGTTIALIESFGDPDVQSFISSYDEKYGLPTANVSTITPAGALPTCTDDNAEQTGCRDWVGETDLDVAMVHAMAPQANIVIVASPVNETQGFAGLPEMMVGINYVVKHKLADVISMSLGTTEETFPTLNSVKTLLPAFNRAAKAGIPITVSTGDTGATGNTIDSSYQGEKVYPFRCVSFPADVPSVVGVGGTVVSWADGARTQPDQLIGFSGAGLSKVFKRPAYQNSVAKITGSKKRSIVDITMDGASGTSQSSPLFAGVLALVKQNVRGPLGNVNAALYGVVGPKGTKSGVVDVTKGDNSYAGVPGFTATKGYDVASGWGTVNGPKFVPALAKALRKG